MIVVLAVVVALVAVDAIGRLDERGAREPERDPMAVTTQKIIVDLTKRQ